MGRPLKFLQPMEHGNVLDLSPKLRAKRKKHVRKKLDSQYREKAKEAGKRHKLLDMTTEEILAKCEKRGDCMIWLGSVKCASDSTKPRPVMNSKVYGPKFIDIELFERKAGHRPKAPRFVGRVCQNWLCLNQDHLIETSRFHEQHRTLIGSQSNP